METPAGTPARAKRLRDRVRARLGVPPDLLGRVRWLALGFGLAMAAVVGPLLLGSVAHRGPPTYLAAAALVVLGLDWARAYRRGGFAPLDDALACVALVLFGAAVDDPSRTIGLFFAAAALRTLYGRSRRVLPAVGGMLVAFAGISATAHRLAPADSLVAGTTFALATACLYALAVSIQRFERLARREAILADAGVALVAAGNRGEIRAAVLDAARRIASQDGPARVALAERAGDPDETGSWAAPGALDPCLFSLVSAAGVAADRLAGVTIDLSGLDGGRAPDGRVDLPPGHGLLPGLPPLNGTSRAAAMTLVPLRGGGTVAGYLTVETEAPLASIEASGLEALAGQAVLAMDVAALAADLEARRSEARFEALVQHSSDVVTVVDTAGHIRWQSPSIERVFGYRPDALVGRPLSDWIHEDDAAHVYNVIHEVAAQPAFGRLVDCRVHDDTGTLRHAEIAVNSLMSEPSVEGIVLNIRDVTERRALEEQVVFQAYHDPLTRLANRALFRDHVQQALAYQRREEEPFAVLFLDLDAFKRVNDSLGHGTGDQVLATIAARLRATIREPDTVARLGGDEFGVLIERVGSPAVATAAAERILRELHEPLSVRGAEVSLQASIGVVVSESGDTTADELLRDADVAMYRAKALGDGGYVLFERSMHADALARLQRESELRRSIEEEDLVLHYQPTVELATRRITGMEALVRWQHPLRGLLAPDEFIALAEETGLIVPLGRWVLHRACHQAREWLEHVPDGDLFLSVNLSARQLRHPDIVSDVAAALDDSGLPPDRLVLEITETMLVSDTAATLGRLLQLKSIGIRLAIDDFGTGYSSLSYLQRFPIDILKIDKSFIEGIDAGPSNHAVVDAMIRIGKALRLETVAEGVERVDQLDRLRALECDVAQGFLFSRPLDSDAMTELLRGTGRAGSDGHIQL